MKRLKANFEHLDKRGVFLEVYRGKGWKELNFFSLKRGFSRGGHYHKKTLELFFVIEGKCLVKIVNIKNPKLRRFIAREKDIFLVEPYETHYLKALQDTKMIALLSVPHNKNKPDVYEAPDSKTKR